jgi:hypothetical protein
MTGHVVSDDDMPNFPWPGRRDASAIEDAFLAALLSGQEPQDVPAGLQPAEDVLAALKARPSGDELAGHAAAMAEFRQHVGVSAPVRSLTRRRPALLTSLMSAKVAAAAAAVAIAIGGVATAAYAGALPSGAQSFAHHWIGAPAAHGAKPTAGMVAIHHTAPAVPAACVTYWRAKAHGTKAQQSAAYTALVKAAGGANKIATYCGLARHRHHRHHFLRRGCFAPVPNASWSPRPQPSGSPGPRPSWSPRPMPSPNPSCTPVPMPSVTSRPHHHHPVFRFGRHHHRFGKPGFPGHKPGPAPSPMPTPTASPSQTSMA